MKTIFAIILMCFTGFAFAEADVMEGSKEAREEGSVPDTSVDCCEGGMAPPVEGDGELGHDSGAMGAGMAPPDDEGPIIEEID